jgi:crotonobetainyl-CoA:carnitine CoA-transferase CaiB-like acyl-CoA transferase
VHGALAVVLALLARQSSGRGDVIEVPLAAAGASAMGSAVLQITPQPRRYDLPEWPRMLSHLALPTLRALVGMLPWAWQRRIDVFARNAVPALMSSYRCADGRLLYVFAVDHDRFPSALLEVTGLWPRLQTEGLVRADPYAPASGTGAGGSNISDSTRLSRRWQARLRRELASCFIRRSADAWEAELTAAGIPCSVQRETGEWLRQPSLHQARIVERSEDGLLGPGPAVWLAERSSKGSRVRANMMHQKRGDSRLSGRLVLDLTSMVAGPVCGRTLAEYGADVIKIDSPNPHHGPRLTCWYGVDVNQGKRSLLLDIARTDGRAVLERMIGRADVVLHNLSDRACAKLRLTADEFHAVNPRLVVARIGAFRGPCPGPWDSRKGYDPVLQAASGIMLRYGGPGTPVHHGIASCVDYLTGYLAAWSVALGLLHRARRGEGCEAVTSLAQAAQLIQLPFAVAGHDSSPPLGSSGQWAWGEHALHRLYRARDGWVFLAAPLGARDRVCAALGLVAAEIPEKALAGAIGRAIRKRRRAALIEALCDRTIAVAAVEPLERLAVTPTSAPGTPLQDGTTLRVVLSRGPEGEEIRTLAPTYARARSAPLLQLAPAPRLGADTKRVLAEFGLGDVEIERLLRDDIASQGFSSHLLPD